MPIRRKPGEIMEVDWAGSTLQITDRWNGEMIPAYVFIATLPYSQLNYVEAFLDMKSSNWLTAHIHVFEYFGGVPETLVPDNLKTGVTKALRGEPLLNEAYREIADYYRTVVVPALFGSLKISQVLKEPLVFISMQIIASLRHYQCFHIEGLIKPVLHLISD